MVSFFLGQLIAVVWITLGLRIVDGREISGQSLLPGGTTRVSYIIASLLFSVMVFVGLVLLIIPGLIVAVIFGLYGWALVDGDLPPIEALQESSRLTRGHRGQLFLFVLAATLLNLVGLLALLVGADHVGRHADRRRPRLPPVGGFDPAGRLTPSATAHDPDDHSARDQC